MNIVGKLSLMIPWSIFLLHSLLSTLQGKIFILFFCGNPNFYKYFSKYFNITSYFFYLFFFTLEFVNAI